MGSAVHPEDEGYEWRGGAGLMAGTGGPSALDPPHASALYLGQPPPRRVRDYSPAQPPPAQPEGQHSIRLPRTWPQRAGGVLIAAAVVASALWYIPSVLHDNGQLLTGTV